jgi:hypothetical protein
MRRAKRIWTWSGRPRPRFPRVAVSKKSRPVTGRPRTWVRLHSSWRIEQVYQTVDVIVVDHGRAAHDPRGALPSRGVRSSLGAEDPGLLLGLVDEGDPFGSGEAGQVRRHHGVLPLPGGEGQERDVLAADRGRLTETQPALLRQCPGVGCLGVGWVSALRAPVIREMVEHGAPRLSLFDARNLPESAAPENPGGLLFAGRHPRLA